MSQVEKVLAELGLELPPTPKPVASYVPAVQSGNLVFTAGQLPKKDGQLIVEGLVGKEVSQEQAQEAAKLCALNALSAAKSVIGDLDRVTRVVKITVFVACTPDFFAHPQVANGASDFLLQVFGEKGKHARSAVASPSLPANTPVEVEMILEVK
jgi:enamine deaminase RidA (YjgF/YER057c/UK114 family)